MPQRFHMTAMIKMHAMKYNVMLADLLFRVTSLTHTAGVINIRVKFRRHLSRHHGHHIDLSLPFPSQLIDESRFEVAIDTVDVFMTGMGP